jgi:hypothetical protein
MAGKRNVSHKSVIGVHLVCEVGTLVANGAAIVPFLHCAHLSDVKSFHVFESNPLIKSMCDCLPRDWN